MADARQRKPPANDAGDITSVRLWEIQFVRDLLLVASVVGLLYLGFLMRLVTVPLLLGVTLAYLFEPLVAPLARRIGRPAAALTIIVGAAVVIGVPVVVGAGVAAVQGAQFLEELNENFPEVKAQIRDTFGSARERFGGGGFGGDDEAAPASGGSTAEPAPDEQPGEADDSGGGPEGAEPQQPQEQAQAEDAAPDDERERSPGEQGADDEPQSGEDAEADQAAQPPMRWLDLVENWLVQSADQLRPQQLAQGGQRAIQVGWKIVAAVAYIFFTAFFLTPFFFYFASVGFGRLRGFGESLIPEHSRDDTMDILRKMDNAISAFVRGRITIAAILGVLLTVGWWIAGVPVPLIIGPVVGALSVVPYLALVGWPVAVVALWMAQAGASDPMPWWLIIVGPTAVYWIVQTIDDYVLTPLIQGKATGLDTPMVLIAVLGAGAMAGVYGVLVAIPAAACIKILVTDVFWPRYRRWVKGQVKDPLPIEEGG